MIPFPGESLGIDVALDVGLDDYGIYDSLRNRGGIGSAPEALAFSGEWRLWVYPGAATYLEEPGADVVVSWVVEVFSGAGTVTATMGLDPLFGDPGAADPIDLGTHIVSGAGSLVIPTTLTAADILDGPDSFMLRLVGSGITVQQVKLRVWPVAGVAGGWSGDLSGFTPGEVPPGQWWHTFDRVGTDTDTDAYAAWVDANTTQSGGPVPGVKAFTGSLVGNLGARGTITATAGLTWEAEAITDSALLVLVGPDWRSSYPISGEYVEGVHYIRPPEEVQEDQSALVQRLADGFVTWPADDVTLLVYGTDQEFGGPTVHAATTDALTVTVTGFDTVSIDAEAGAEFPKLVSHPSEGATLQTNASLGLSSGRYGVVTFSHTFASGEGGPWTGLIPAILGAEETAVGQYTPILGDGLPDDPTFLPIMAQANLPGYRMWLPEIVTPPTIRPVRQYHRDDGLGVTPPRAYGGASRIRTGRAYGYD